MSRSFVGSSRTSRSAGWSIILARTILARSPPERRDTGPAPQPVAEPHPLRRPPGCCEPDARRRAHASRATVLELFDAALGRLDARLRLGRSRLCSTAQPGHLATDEARQGVPVGRL